MSSLQVGSDSSGTFGRAVVVGFASSVAVWITWFMTHLPWVGMSEPVSMPIVLGVWLLAGAFAVAWTGCKNPVIVGILGGVVCALVGLLVLGTKVVPDAAPDGITPGGTRDTLPSVALIIPAFLVLGGAIGLAAGLASRLAPKLCAGPSSALAQMGVVVAIGITPLLVVGGLVTSTDSGMAVPDWPNTFGSNMFLYPLGPRSEPGLFLEHAHRLFGSLVGLMTLILAGWVIAKDGRRWVKVLAVVALSLVIVQGVLGGWRVLAGSDIPTEDNRWLAMLHGVLGQLVFGVVVALAATLSPLFRSAATVQPHASIRRFKVFSAGLTHALILQLIFGAMYRHMRSGHALWTHAGFSVVIMVLAIVAGFVAIGLARRDVGEDSPAGPAAAVPALACTLRRIGLGLIIVVALQFALGWAAFFVGGAERTAANPTEALIRTAHQANGAILIAFASLAFVWSRWVLRRAGVSAVSAPAGAA